MYENNNEIKDWNELYSNTDSINKSEDQENTEINNSENKTLDNIENNRSTILNGTAYQNTNYYERPDTTYHYSYRNEHQDTKKKTKKGFTAGKVVALALCCSLVGGLVGAGGMAVFGNKNNTAKGFLPNNQPEQTTVYEGQREAAVININNIDTSKLLSAAEVYAKNVNSTVGITTSITTNYFGYQTTAAASGSGFVLTENGYILTNYHVVEDANSVKVTMYDNSSYQADVIGYDSSNDVAVLKIDAENLTPVIIGDSDALNVGDSVVAIGNPLGELTFSLTSGSVSALDRPVTFSNSQTMRLIQTDCAINSGNSGGALFNMYGEVIGITNAKYSASGSSTSASIENIGFAIPINTVKSIYESIIEKGYVSKPYIGVTVGTVSEEAKGYGLPAGATVRTIVEGSPAEKAGLEINDIITEADGTGIESSSDLVAAVADKQIGDVIKLKVYRQGETIDISLTIGEQKQTAVQNEEIEQSQSQQYQQQTPFSFPFGFSFG